MPSGRGKSVTPQLELTSWVKPCHVGAATSVDRTGFCAVRTGDPSELPFHTPTTSAYSPLSRPAWSGGGRYPYATRSFASWVVPVLSTAGRRVPSEARTAKSPQIGFCLGSVFE